MKKTKFSHKVMAIFLTLTFLPSVMPINFLYASNNGPNAPEAASFEPVDATDMVNLVTGDMSYVLPLLNVPSPEGGYPVSLSYHAGIAMDQEASWVGLGWSLNPGAINRGVNGYPDDWGKTNVNEFFYDQGFEEDYYSFSAGGRVSNTLSVGLGASWGSNQALGGFVEASFGPKTANIGGRIGTNNSRIAGTIGGFNASVGTNGVGLGYGSLKNIGNTNSRLGVSLNYSPNSGLSGGVKVNSSHSESSGDALKTSSLGVNFSSKGISTSGSVNRLGAGISTSSPGSSGGAYDVVTTSTYFNLPIYNFYIGYQHQNVKYSLFQNNNLFTSGMLNPVDANALKSYDDNSGLSRAMKENYFMDVNVIPKYSNTKDVNILTEVDDQMEENNLVLPSYDNYAISAQGLSGSLKPYIHSEINLSGRGVKNDGTNSTYLQYLNHDVTEYNSAPSSGINVNRDALKKVNFTFENAYNSFLRLETSNINNPGYLDANIGDNTVLEGFTTQDSGTYLNNNSLTSAYESQKREGNFIRTFTNQEIRGGSISGFVEANTLNRQEEKTFLDEGIGAYQITTMDGRTYHYSLPVYNFESFYRNFNDDSSNIPEDDKNFFEIQKTTPYATHWLLTGVTGPDYVDKNTNGKLDEGDYGYWVEFDYGKWSDGYAWQTPNGRYDEDEDEEGNITYSYSRGVKQIYYLDAIKTRTHTALFVKDLRGDNESMENLNKNNQEWTSGSFDPLIYPKQIPQGRRYIWNTNIWGDSGKEYYNVGGDKVLLPNTVGDCENISSYEGLAVHLTYSDIPKNQTLGLSKIILLKNEDVNVDKAQGNLNTILTGAVYNNLAHVNNEVYGTYEGFAKKCPTPVNYYTGPNNFRTFQAQLHPNVLDVKDIEGLNLENSAQQVIDFDHDYSLAQGSPNSNAIGKGRLSLKRVDFKGKQGIQLIPPYKFSYASFSSQYNHNNEDAWGYNKVYPAAWSLNEIETPTGGKIKINYESDSYYTQAATYENKYFDDIDLTQLTGTTQNPIIYEVTVNENINPADYFKIGRECLLSYKTCGTSGSEISNKPFEVLATSGSTVSIVPVPDIYSNGSLPSCTVVNLKIKNNTFPLYTDANSNGKQGGGLRVKTLSVTGENTDLTTEYIYTDPKTDNTSGITSYAPVKNESQGIPYVSELPSPTIMYGHVNMVNKDAKGKILGNTSYEFETLKPFENESSPWIYSLGDAFKVDNSQQNNRYNNDKVVVNKSTILSSLSNVGRLLSVSSYNSNDDMLQKTTNQYKVGLDNDGEIGVNQESHKSLKRVMTKPGFGPYIETFYVSSTSKVSYPSVLESTTTHQGNFSKTTTYDTYDFLTGQVLETTTKNSEGNEFKSQSFLAFNVDEYAVMGSKYDDLTNKNMLAQEAISKTLLKVGNAWENMGIGITTWSPDLEDVWRKHKSFIWDGDTNSNGVFTNFTGDDDNFDWSLEENQQDVVQPTQWKQISEISQYDQYSMPLEVIDINGNKAATKMGDNDSKIIATGNAGYYSMAFNGAEYNENFNSIVGRTDERAHTGEYSLEITSEQGFKTGFWNNTPGVYRISVWASKDNYQNARIFDGSSVVEFNQEKVIAGDWVMLNHEVQLGAEPKEIYVTSNSGTTFFDDFRIHPVESSITSYVYNEWDELSYLIGPNNLGTHYEYDEAGRLLRSSAELIEDGLFEGGFKKSAEYRYNYKGIGDIDENGNGTVDPNEGLDDLGIIKNPENRYNAPGTLTIIPTGGSGQFTYRYASGIITTSAEAAALPFGSSTSNNEFYVSTVPCDEVNQMYQSFAVKIEVRDTVTGNIKTDIAYYGKVCDDNGGGEPEQ